MFDAHVPAKYRDVAPQVVVTSDGKQQWWYCDRPGRNLGLNAVAGKPREMFNVDALPLRRDAARLLRRPRAGARHGRRRAARRAELPELHRVLGAGPEPGPRSATSTR